MLALSKSGTRENFYKCPPSALTWSTRKHRIMDEILKSKADIICLEEVDHYSDFFNPILTSLDYIGLYMPKPDSPCLLYNENNGPDGCALFFSSKKFSLILHEQFVLRNGDGEDTNQVAIVVLLETTYLAKPKKICVASTHLKSHSSEWCENLRKEQSTFLLKRIGELIDFEYIPVIVCGDFNTEPNTPTYANFANFQLCNMKSAYAINYLEPKFTTWKFRPGREICHTIDYIWFSSKFLSLTQFLAIPSTSEIGTNALPAECYPSDHVSLVAEFCYI